MLKNQKSATLPSLESQIKEQAKKLNLPVTTDNENENKHRYDKDKSHN